MTLHIADGTELPDELATDTVAILAKRGGGKSNAAVVMAEEMHRVGQQWVAIDPKGDWWGIRADRSGDGPGLPVPVFGGLHGDLPLEPGAGKLMARLVVERDITCVLDVSDFSKGEQIRFATDFVEELFRLVRHDPRVLHLFIEEAEEFLPQRVTSNVARMVGATSKLSKQGRAFGLGVTLVTQRSASLNKDALSQTGTLILFRTPSPHDLKAAVAWLDHEDHELAAEVKRTLPTLQPGEAWILSPDSLGEVRRVQWRLRSTFDSGATPKVGQRHRTPTGLADIDLDEVAALMADTVERAQAEDPKKLRARITDLERQLATQPAPEPTVVEVPVVDPAVIDHLEHLQSAYQHLDQDLDQTLADLRTAARTASAVPPPSTPAPPPPRRTAAVSGSATRDEAHETGNQNLAKAEREILSVLAQHATEGRTAVQIALLTGRSSKGGGFKNALSSLRTRELIDRGDPIMITTAGLAAIDGQYEPLPTGAALVDHWANHLGRAEGLILRYLVDVAPRSATREEVAAATGYEPNGGGFKNALSKLRTLQLIEGRQELTATATLVGRS